MIDIIWAYAVGAMGLVAGAFMIWRDGRRSAQRKNEQAASEQRRKINDVDSQMAKMDDGDVRSNLAKWVRDDG